jgi:hypothetical protein
VNVREKKHLVDFAGVALDKDREGVGEIDGGINAHAERLCHQQSFHHHPKEHIDYSAYLVVTNPHFHEPVETRSNIGLKTFCQKEVGKHS